MQDPISLEFLFFGAIVLSLGNTPLHPWELPSTCHTCFACSSSNNNNLSGVPTCLVYQLSVCFVPPSHLPMKNLKPSSARYLAISIAPFCSLGSCQGLTVESRQTQILLTDAFRHLNQILMVFFCTWRDPRQQTLLSTPPP